LFNEDESPVSAQDGTKFLCGNLRMRVTEDAAGTFTIGFLDDPDRTLLVDAKNEKIEPVQSVPLIVHISSPTQWLRIQTSVPENGAIDARLLSRKERYCHWDSVSLTSSGDAAELRPGDFEVIDGSENPPRIEKLEVGAESAGTAVLRLNHGIAEGRWTKIVHKPSQSAIQIGCLPGDVNNDAALDGRDVMNLIEVLNGARQLPPERTDLNSDNTTTAQDLVRLVDAVASHANAGVRITPLTD
jgi:hypothetical protein